MDLEAPIRIVPVIDPIQHAEKSIRGNCQVDSLFLSALLLQVSKNPSHTLCVLLLLVGHVLIPVARQRLTLVRQNFHLGHIRCKEGEMVLDEDAQSFYWFVNVVQAFFKPLENATKTVILN